jgi:queuosine precursor transporter
VTVAGTLPSRRPQAKVVVSCPPARAGGGLPDEPHLRRLDTGGDLPQFRYFDLVMAGFVTVLLCSNIIGPGKTVRFELWGLPLVFGAGNLFFPISYIFDDVLTEVYGYAHARRAVWAGFFALVFAAVMSFAVIHLPVNQGDAYSVKLDPAIALVFGNGPRIILASIVGFWVGDFANSYVLAKMKILTGGRWLWTRTIGSTIVGEGVDSLVFYPIAFAGLWQTGTLLQVIVFNWFVKVMLEVVLTPVTYKVVNGLKRAEGIDLYDSHTDFTPFSLKE